MSESNYYTCKYTCYHCGHEYVGKCGCKSSEHYQDVLEWHRADMKQKEDSYYLKKYGPNRDLW